MKRADKLFISIIVAIIVIISVLLAGYDMNLKRQLKVVKINKRVNLTENNDNFQYSIDSITIDNELCKIKGWAIIKGINSYNVMPSIILKDKAGNLYKINTRISKRQDITQLYNGTTMNYNTHLTCVTKSGIGVTKYKNVYDNCGINSYFRINDLKQNQNYLIGIQLNVNNRNYFIWTNTRLKL